MDYLTNNTEVQHSYSVLNHMNHYRSDKLSLALQHAKKGQCKFTIFVAFVIILTITGRGQD